jgi:hypothetical protein
MNGLIVDYIGIFDDVARALDFDETAVRLSPCTQLNMGQYFGPFRPPGALPAPLTKRTRLGGDCETRIPTVTCEGDLEGERSPDQSERTAFPQYWPFQQVHASGPLTGRPENS